MKKLFLLAGVALSLSGCASVGGALLSSVLTASTPVAAVGDKVVFEGTKGLAVAADAYTGVTLLIKAAVTHGAFTDGQLAMIRTLNDQAIKLINGADTSLTVAERAASLGLIVTQLHSILGK